MKIRSLSVTEVNNYIKNIIDGDPILNNINVEGEISNLKKHSSGHYYFNLKDDDCRVNCVMFKSYTKALLFDLKEGDNVRIYGNISVYNKTGQYQLYSKKIENIGIGKLYQKFLAMKNLLESKGFFDIETKKKLPSTISKVGIVTSPTGAAIRDVLSIINKRTNLLDVMIYPAKVQGKNAHREIEQGIEYFEDKADVDVVIITRGGGSIEDLWAFNERSLAETIFKATKPIISAVGHEVDFTISDFVADIRVATPSFAGELVSIDDANLTDSLNDLIYGMNRLVKNKFQTLKYEQKMLDFDRINQTLFNTISTMKLNSDYELSTIDQSVTKAMEALKKDLISTGELLELSNPVHIINKGFSLTSNKENNLIKNISQVAINDRINVRVSDGTLMCDVIGIKGDE